MLKNLKEKSWVEEIWLNIRRSRWWSEQYQGREVQLIWSQKDIKFSLQIALSRRMSTAMWPCLLFDQVKKGPEEGRWVKQQVSIQAGARKLRRDNAHSFLLSTQDTIEVPCEAPSSNVLGLEGSQVQPELSANDMRGGSINSCQVNHMMIH